MTRLLIVRARLPWVVAAPLVIGLLESLWPSFFEWHLGVALWRAWPLVQVAEIGGAAAVSSLVVLINVVVADFGGAVLERRVPRGAALMGAGGSSRRGRAVS